VGSVGAIKDEEQREDIGNALDDLGAADITPPEEAGRGA
jgi:hypothetical protein